MGKTHTLEWDDDDVRAAHIVADFALKYGGLAAFNAVTRLLNALPALEEKEEAPQEAKKG